MPNPNYKKIYVFGHQKPDTDSICATIAYTAFKKATGTLNAVACRLGPINKETRYALDYFDADDPILIKSVEPQVADVHLSSSAVATENDSVHKTMEMIIDTPGRSLPVIDKDRHLAGIVSLPDIMHAYTDPFRKDMLKKADTPYKNLVAILDARILGVGTSVTVKGDLYDNSQLVAGEKLNPDDIVLTAYRDGCRDRAFEHGNNIVIIADTPKDETPDIPSRFDGLVLLTDKPTFEVVRLLEQGMPIKNYINRETMEFFMVSETLKDVQGNMMSSPHNRFPVVDDDGHVLGTITKSSLLNFDRKQVILVDHNERTQSIEGLENAEITEVIDHHRIAEIQTAAPLYMRVEPVGCTCTIITKMYNEKEIPIPKKIAGLLLSAIISDTLLFNSPTCTEQDIEAAHQLADIAKVNLKEYGRNMLIAGSNVSDMTPAQIVGADRKIFTMGDYKVAISQINTGDYKGLFNQLKPLLAEMNKNCEDENLDLAILMVTDIVLGGSELLVAGKQRDLVEKAFGIEDGDISQFFPKMFSRKKQVVPPLMNVASMD